MADPRLSLSEPLDERRPNVARWPDYRMGISSTTGRRLTRLRCCQPATRSVFAHCQDCAWPGSALSSTRSSCLFFRHPGMGNLPTPRRPEPMLQSFLRVAQQRDPGERRRRRVPGHQSCTQRLLGTRIGQASHQKTKPPESSTTCSAQNDHTHTPGHHHTTPFPLLLPSLRPPFTSSLGLARPPSLPLSLDGFLSALVFPPQLFPVTCCPTRHGQEARNWTTKQGLNNHAEMRTAGFVEGKVLDQWLTGISLHICPVCSRQLCLCQDQTMLLQVLPSLQQPSLTIRRRLLSLLTRVPLNSHSKVALEAWARCLVDALSGV